MRSAKTVLAVAAATAIVAAAGCSSSTSTGSTTGSGETAPTSLTVWRMGGSVPTEVTWMNGVIKQFHQVDGGKYKNTKVNVVWIPWANVSTDFQNALTTGKNAPDISEIGNTLTPADAAAGMLYNMTSDVNSMSNKSDIVAGMLANDTVNGQIYGVPWYGGVRGVWYKKDQFAAAGITSTPTTWAELVADAKKLQQKFPGTVGLAAPSDFTNGIVSWIWGAGGQVATKSGSQWTADLTTPASEAGIKAYADLYLTDKVSPSKYIGKTELGNPGATSGGPNEDFALGTVDMYMDGAWGQNTFPANKKDASNYASFPLPSENGPNPAPAFAGGSDLAIWKTSKYPAADWALIQEMDSTTNATSFGNLLGYFPAYTSVLNSNPVYTSSPVLSGFAKAAAYTQISPLNSPNWGTADISKYNIIPTMMKDLMDGANFQATVQKANTELTQVLNTGSES